MLVGAQHGSAGNAVALCERDDLFSVCEILHLITTEGDQMECIDTVESIFEGGCIDEVTGHYLHTVR